MIQLHLFSVAGRFQHGNRSCGPIAVVASNRRDWARGMVPDLSRDAHPRAAYREHHADALCGYEHVIDSAPVCAATAARIATMMESVGLIRDGCARCFCGTVSGLPITLGAVGDGYLSGQRDSCLGRLTPESDDCNRATRRRAPGTRKECSSASLRQASDGCSDAGVRSLVFELGCFAQIISLPPLAVWALSIAEHVRGSRPHWIRNYFSGAHATAPYREINPWTSSRNPLRLLCQLLHTGTST